MASSLTSPSPSPLGTPATPSSLLAALHAHLADSTSSALPLPAAAAAAAKRLLDQGFAVQAEVVSAFVRDPEQGLLFVYIDETHCVISHALPVPSASPIIANPSSDSLCFGLLKMGYGIQVLNLGKDFRQTAKTLLHLVASLAPQPEKIAVAFKQIEASLSASGSAQLPAIILSLPPAELFKQNVTPDMLNRLQSLVQTWIKEIQRVTLVSNDLAECTSCVQEVDFWLGMELALLQVREQVEQPIVKQTLETLRTNGRALVVTLFESDANLTQAETLTRGYLETLRDCPVRSVTSSASLSGLQAAIEAFFTHVERAGRMTAAYPLERLLGLVRLLWRDADARVAHLALSSNRRLLASSPTEFAQTHAQVAAIYQLLERKTVLIWDDARDWAKRKGVTRPSRPVSRVFSLMEDIAKLRKEHEQLAQAANRALGGVEDAQLGQAMHLLVQANPLEEAAWMASRQAYQLGVDQVESRLLAHLVGELDRSESPDDMFALCAKFSTFFQRPRVRHAVQQFTSRLLASLEQQLHIVSAHVTKGYRNSPAAALCKSQGLTEAVGHMVWCRQLQGRIELLLQRLRSILGDGWTQSALGARLDELAQSLLTRVDLKPLLQQWTSSAQDRLQKSQPSRLLKISESGVIQADVNPASLRFYEEVRAVSGLGLHVPFFLQLSAQEAKVVAPIQRKVSDSLRAYHAALARVGKDDGPLCVHWFSQVQSAIEQMWIRGASRWDSETVSSLAANLATRCEALSNGQVLAKKLVEQMNVLVGRLLKAETGSEVAQIRAQAQQKLDAVVDLCNIRWFAAQMEKRIQDTLAQRAQSMAASWCARWPQEFEPMVHRLIVVDGEVIVVEPLLESSLAALLDDAHRVVQHPSSLAPVYELIGEAMAQAHAHVKQWQGHFGGKPTGTRLASDAILVSLDVDEFLEGDWEERAQALAQRAKNIDESDLSARFGAVVVDHSNVQAAALRRTQTQLNDLCQRLVRVSMGLGSQSVADWARDRHALERGGLLLDLLSLLSQFEAQRKRICADYSRAERLLQRYRISLPRDWVQASRLSFELDALEQARTKQMARLDRELPLLRARHADAWVAHLESVAKAVGWWSGLSVPESSTLALAALTDVRSRLDACKEEDAKLLRSAASLNLPPPVSAVHSLEAAQAQVALLLEAWLRLKSDVDEVQQLLSSPWSVVSLHNIKTQCSAISSRIASLSGDVARSPPYALLKEKTTRLSAAMSMVNELKSTAMARHLRDAWTALGLQERDPALGVVVDGIAKHEGALAPILERARGEAALDEFVASLSSFWESASVAVVPFGPTASTSGNVAVSGKFTKGLPQLGSDLDERLSQLIVMRQSPWFPTFAAEVARWEARLVGARDIQKALLQLQVQWIHLSSLFASDGVRKALPEVYAQFKAVDQSVWLRRLPSNSLALDGLSNIPKSALESQLSQLEAVKRALSGFLAETRRTYPRLFLLGDDDCLTLITGGLAAVQSFASLLFPAVRSISVADGKVLALQGKTAGEELSLRHPVDSDSKTEAMALLASLERELTASLKHAFKSALVARRRGDAHWFSNGLPVQLALLVERVHFTEAFERDRAAAKAGNEVMLANLVGGQTPGHRALVAQGLLHRKVCDAASLEWWLRHRWDESTETIWVRMANVEFSYGWEWTEHTGLVQTALTGKCFAVLTQALKHGFGGAPIGPAGTGKTETVKALAQILGRLCIVFNCDERFDPAAVSRLLLGLCRLGAWGCFDEMNRLQAATLSAVSEQVSSIQRALKRRSTTVVLPGTEEQAPLHPDVGIFITMNPGYQGRARLPGNTELLFRKVAMVVPDFVTIAQVDLWSRGFAQAEDLAMRADGLLAQCRRSLSPQVHYDFGLRALKTILSCCCCCCGGSTAVAFSPEEERRVLAKAVWDCLVPALTPADMAAFQQIFTETMDVRPHSWISPADDQILQAVSQTCARAGVVLGEKLSRKILQVKHQLDVHHGVILIGLAGSGKSLCLRLLLDALQRLDNSQSAGAMHVMDAKAMGKDKLFGVWDASSGEWTDGALTRLMADPSPARRWVVLDGDIDPVWAENLNSVLDDNKVLSLPNGTRLALPPNMRIVFECDSLEHATLATVSRCGVVFFPVLDEMPTPSLPATPTSNTAAGSLFRKPAAESLIAAAVATAKTCLGGAAYEDVLLARDLFFKGETLIRDAALSAAPVSASDVSEGFVAQWAGFSALWGLGLRRTEEERSVAATALAGVLAVPVSCMDLPVLGEPNPRPFASVADRTVELVRLFASGKRLLLLSGPRGCGKTRAIEAAFSGSGLTALHVSPKSVPSDLFQLLDRHCSMGRSAQGRVLAPLQGGTLVVALLGIDMAGTDAYGSSALLALVRSFIEHGGCWRDLEWTHIDRIVFVATCTLFHELPRRLLRLSSVLAVAAPSRAALAEELSGLCKGKLSDADANRVVGVACDFYFEYSRRAGGQPASEASPRDVVNWVKQTCLLASDLAKPDDLALLLLFEGTCAFAYPQRKIDDVRWCESLLRDLIQAKWSSSLPIPDLLLFTAWGGQYRKTEPEEMRAHLQRSIVEVAEFEPHVVNLVLVEDVVAKAVYVARALESGHVELIGAPGNAKRTLTRLAAHAQGRLWVHPRTLLALEREVSRMLSHASNSPTVLLVDGPDVLDRLLALADVTALLRANIRVAYCGPETPARRRLVHSTSIVFHMWSREDQLLAARHFKAPDLLVEIFTYATRKRENWSSRGLLDLALHFSMFRSELAKTRSEAQARIKRAVKQLDAAALTVQRLTSALGEQETSLRAKTLDAERTLEQMVRAQQEAEARRAEADAARERVERSADHVSKQKQLAEKELALAEPALLEAQQAVSRMGRREVDELRTMANPPDLVKWTLEAVVRVVGGVPKDQELSWGEIRKRLQSKDIISAIAGFDPQSVDSDARAGVTRLLQTPELTDANVQRASSACLVLFRWVKSQIKFVELMGKVQPLRDSVEQLGADASELAIKLNHELARVAQLEARIAECKSEYMQLVAGIEQTKAEIRMVRDKVARASRLVGSLEEERKRWSALEAEKDEFLDLRSLCRAVAACVLGSMNAEQREGLVRTFSSLCLEPVPADVEASWTQLVPEADDFVRESLGLVRWQRLFFPLLVDPEGLAHELWAKSRSRAVTKISCLDPGFARALEAACKFGTCLFVADAEHLNPEQIAPVVERRGGMGINASFELVLLSRSNAVKLPEALMSRVALFSFVPTSASLRHVCASLMHRLTNPAGYSRTCELSLLVPQLRAKLSGLEDSLLQLLSDANEGDLLERDEVAGKLDGLQVDAQTVADRVAETRAAHLAALTELEKHQALAARCAAMYMTLTVPPRIASKVAVAQSILLRCIKHAAEQGLPIRGEAVLRRLFAEVASGLATADRLLVLTSLCHALAPQERTDSALALSLSSDPQGTLDKAKQLCWNILQGPVPDLDRPALLEDVLKGDSRLCVVAAEVGQDANLRIETGLASLVLVPGGPLSSEARVAALLREGGTVLLTNAHLCSTSFVESLPGLVAGSPTCKVVITWDAAELLPKALLSHSRVVLLEAPHGLRRGLSDALEALRVSSLSPRVRERLAYLHAVLVERARLRPIGLCKGHSFGPSELEACARAMEGLGENWPLLEFLARTYYAAKVDDTRDEAIVTMLIKDAMRENWVGTEADLPPGMAPGSIRANVAQQAKELVDCLLGVSPAALTASGTGASSSSSSSSSSSVPPLLDVPDAPGGAVSSHWFGMELARARLASVGEARRIEHLRELAKTGMGVPVRLDCVFFPRELVQTSVQGGGGGGGGGACRLVIGSAGGGGGLRLGPLFLFGAALDSRGVLVLHDMGSVVENAILVAATNREDEQQPKNQQWVRIPLYSDASRSDLVAMVDVGASGQVNEIGEAVLLRGCALFAGGAQVFAKLI